MWDISNQKLGRNNFKKVRDQILLRADFLTLQFFDDIKIAFEN